MAEARTGDEEESLRETRESGAGSRRNPRSSSAAAERAERNKPEQRHSTQGALSSIRAAIKRTSTRTAPTEQNRDRRRPQITIVAAEPLASNTWFPGSSGAFPPPPPPPAQPSWTGPLTVELPPPSYDQVIKEKSREQNPPNPSVSSSPSSTLSSTSSSSSSTARTTATIATQTDPEASEPQSLTKPPMRRPPKPPRPSLPFTPKPAEPAPVHSLIDLDEPDLQCASQTPSHRPLSEHSANQTDSTVHLTAALTPTLADPSQITQTSPLRCTVKQEASVPPRPRPRSRALLQPVIREEGQDQQMTRDVRVQTLVRLKDDPAESVFAGFGDGSLDITSNKYLQELLDVFGGDEQVCQGDQGTKSDQSEEEEEDSSESLFAPVASEPLEILIRPEPRPRTRNPKPLILPKPSHLTQDVQEHKDSSKDNKQTASPPAPAPRPLLSKTSASQQHGNKTETSRLPPPPRPPPLSRRSRTPTQAEEAVLDCQAGKNNADDQDRISASPPPKPAPVTATARASQKCPAKPLTQRRPPLPTHTPIQDDVSAVSITKAAASSVPSLPPRPSESRLLPLRPPPVKVTKPGGSSQPPAPANQLSGSRVPKRGPPLPPRPKPGHPLYREKTSKATQRNAKVIRPSTEPEEPHLQKEDLLVVFDDWPTPSSSEKNHNQNEPTSERSQELKIQELKEEQQAKQQPELNATVRYVARFTFQGEDGELTFHEGDVITLIERVNEEWGRGSLDGRAGIFPLSFVQEEASAPKSSTPELPVPPAGKGQTGKVLYDFSPESEDELPLKAGDMVCYLEALDEEWFMAEFAGRRGIVPKNFVQVLQEPKAQS